MGAGRMCSSISGVRIGGLANSASIGSAILVVGYALFVGMKLVVGWLLSSVVEWLILVEITMTTTRGDGGTSVV